MQVPIKVSHLKAVSLFAGDKDIRYYLNGVLVDVLPDAIRLCATDGHTMALTHTPNDQGVGPPTVCQFIIPIDTVKAAIRSAGKAEFVFGEPPEGVYLTQNEKPHNLRTADTTLHFTPIDGKFPDYFRVIPKTCSGEVAHFDPSYIMRFAKAYSVYHQAGRKPFVYLEHNGQGPAIIHGVDPEFCGVVMPWLNKENAKGAPDWLTQA